MLQDTKHMSRKLGMFTEKTNSKKTRAKCSRQFLIILQSIYTDMVIWCQLVLLSLELKFVYIFIAWKLLFYITNIYYFIIITSLSFITESNIFIEKTAAFN